MDMMWRFRGIGAGAGEEFEGGASDEEEEVDSCALVVDVEAELDEALLGWWMDNGRLILPSSRTQCVSSRDTS